MSLKQTNKEIQKKNQNDLRVLEEFYVNGKVDNMLELVEERKKEVVNEIILFQEKYVKTRIDKYGNEEKIVNPYLISTYFFKSINPLYSKNPTYNAEKLSIVWELYMYLVEQVNMQIAPFQPTLTHFAKFAGISLQTLTNYRNSGDEDMMNVCEKIYDECFNGNVSLAQTGLLKEKTTMSRMKIENQVVEKAQPQVSVNLEANVDLNEINKRLEEIKKFNTKVIELDKKKEK